MISFTVYGLPQAQGSAKAFMAGGKVRITTTNKKLYSWRNDVAAKAQEARGDAPLIEGPVAIKLRIYFARPKGHMGTGRNEHVLKPGAPRFWHTQAPDADKIARAIGDALAGILFRDDAQVAHWEIVKAWSEPICGASYIEVDVLEAK